MTLLKSRANRKFKPMSRVPSNYIIKILDHRSFTEVSNNKVPGKFGKNISMINDKFIFFGGLERSSIFFIKSLRKSRASDM